ncbi:hypothetical protein GR702_11550 [Novosphingobium sp. FGD1]|uniref:Uncharacterized protein n=1 Tax=Novosphingobium silvae TaxID=2692619 RepID=A0A7X4GGU6_9SPHN|nr:hypothetical protein [Novosphingobium silvae]MYL98398.1 hypothetical protein [Novosphingobium silvae]
MISIALIFLIGAGFLWSDYQTAVANGDPSANDRLADVWVALAMSIAIPATMYAAWHCMIWISRGFISQRP